MEKAEIVAIHNKRASQLSRQALLPRQFHHALEDRQSIFQLIISNLAPASSQCPSRHPYAYLKGKYCCKYPKENNDPLYNSCNGRDISLESGCCKDHAYRRCPSGFCTTNLAAAGMIYFEKILYTLE